MIRHAGGRASLVKPLALLWLAGAATRVTLLAVPPLLPLLHDDLHLSETEVGLLIGLPVALFAVAAVPGSLLISRCGAFLTLLIGMVVTALAGGARGLSSDVWTLYATTMLMGLGIAITQPALPSLVRAWAGERIGFGTAVATNGMVVGVALAPVLTIPVVLPAVGQSWRMALLLWALPGAATAVLFVLLSARVPRPERTQAGAPRWWPDWKSPVTWLLGFGFAGNNSIYYGVNAFLPDYLTSLGRADLIGHGLGWLNGSQLVASCGLLVIGERIHRRAAPFVIFAGLTFAALVGIVLASGAWIVLWAAVVGFSTAVTFVLLLALPPMLSAPDDVPRTSAGMFTISYTCAVFVPTVSGALWDATHLPFMAFVPLCLGAVTVGGFGAVLSARARRRA